MNTICVRSKTSNTPRRATALALTAATALLVCACSISLGSDDGSAACERFTDITLEIERADISAPGLQSSLERIHADATADGQDDVASAAGDLISAVKDTDSGALYQGLGEIEAACGPHGY